MPERLDQPRTHSNQYRTHTNGELRGQHVGRTVTLSGWVQSRRDHGSLIFIDLRDRWGVTQLVINPKTSQAAWNTAARLRDEFVVTATGNVVARSPGTVNARLVTGAIEVSVTSLIILAESKPLPFPIADEPEAGEEIRLTYRFLDLRRPRLQALVRRRDEFIAHIRAYMHARGFIEVHTPILANSSPEGARDYLVPSRLHPGQFYALPQAPQQFKQLLMVAGLERYFQIAPCFRDEDPRADRHSGEFYQLDLEMSFVEQEDVFALVEPLMIELTEKFSDKKIVTKPFPRLKWHEAMATYGSDKPDLRFGLTMTNVSDIFADGLIAVLSKARGESSVVHALHADDAGKLTRSDFDALTTLAHAHGVSGLSYIVYASDGVRSSLKKSLTDAHTAALMERLTVHPGDVVFLAAGPWRTVCQALGAVRSRLGELLQRKDPRRAAWCWVVDFPMYEYNASERKIDFSHNPFSMPQGGREALAAKDPTTILGYQYDLTLNGYEISSGAIRNHDPELMYRAFAIAGYTREEVDKKFGGMIRAFQYGTPPHGGFAPGIDRLMMVLWDVPSIRDIYAFPKNGRAQDVLMGAPSRVDQRQLTDLHLEIVHSPAALKARH